MELIYSTAARNDLASFDRRLAERILDKMDHFISTPNPLRFARPLTGLKPATHRFRIGDYRVTVAVQSERGCIIVLRVRNRKDIYES